MTGSWIVLAAALVAGTPRADLTITLVGNAGVLLSDGVTSLLVDLPYEPGAFGYMRYDPAALAPAGQVVSVITHHHRDHFDPALFLPREGWRVVGPPSVTAGLPAARVLAGDSVAVGAFAVVSIPTPHTDDHRSYRIRWQGRVLLFVGDTEVPGALAGGPPSDIVFVTPWLSCTAGAAVFLRAATRRIGYHLSPRGNDRICGGVEVLPQGSSFIIGTGEG